MEIKTLQDELEATLDSVNAQIHAVTMTAGELQIDRIYVVDQNGSYAMTPLLLAKAQILSSLAAIK